MKLKYIVNVIEAKTTLVIKTRNIRRSQTQSNFQQMTKTTECSGPITCMEIDSILNLAYHFTHYTEQNRVGQGIFVSFWNGKVNQSFFEMEDKLQA